MVQYGTDTVRNELEVMKASGLGTNTFDVDVHQKQVNKVAAQDKTHNESDEYFKGRTLPANATINR